MNIQIRLTRKPFSTVLWLTLVTAMTVLLCVGAGLWHSSEQTAAIIDELHSTVAYRTDIEYTITDTENGRKWSFTPRNTTIPDQQLLAGLDCVQEVYENTLTGGYSPRFIPSVPVTLKDDFNESYDEVVFIGTITEMETEPYPDRQYDLSGVKLGEIETPCGQACTIQIEEYLSVNEELCQIGTKWEHDTGILYVTCLREEDSQLLEVGGRYLICATYHKISITSLNPPDYYTFSDGMLDGDQLRGVSGMSYQTTDGEEASIPKILTATVGDPFIARIDGTIEEFLADPAHAEWVRILEVQNMAQHSVPILGTESMESMYLFTNSKARIYEGRSITPEEYESGAKVCVISTTLAQNSGIAVGDTIPISQFWCYTGSQDDNASTDTTPQDGRLNNPTIGNVTTNTELMTRDEEFTVVGPICSAANGATAPTTSPPTPSSSRKRPRSPAASAASATVVK